MTVTLPPGAAALEAWSDPLGAEWAGLAAGTAADPFSHPAWVRAWAETIGRPVRIAAVRRAGRLAAAYPVVGDRKGWQSAADWHVPHLDAVGAPDAVRELFAALVAPARRVAFDFANGATAQAARDALDDAHFLVAERLRVSSPWVEFRQGWDAYRESLPSHKWRELRRRSRRLAEQGVLRFDQYRGGEGLDRLLGEGIAVEGSGWKDASGTAVRSDRRVEAFYRRVAGWAADCGMLQLRFLRLDGRAIAFDFALRANGAEWLLKTGYDPTLGHFAPGALLRAEALERACRDGLRYEFLGAAAPWKLEWTDRTRDVVRIEGYRPGVRGRGSRIAARARRLARVRLGLGS